MDRLVFKLIGEKMKISDQRGNKTKEMVSGIKVIKFNALENVMANILSKFKEQEKAKCIMVMLARGFSEAILLSVPPLVALICILTYQEHHNEKLTTAKTFALLGYLGLLLNPMKIILYASQNIAGAYSGVIRINKILVAESMEEVYDIDPSLKIGEIRIDNGNFSYESITAYNYFKDSPFLPPEIFDKDKKIPQILTDINLDIKQGELIAIVGKTGSGKTSILNACINELCKKSGKVQVKGSVSYMAQDAF